MLRFKLILAVAAVLALSGCVKKSQVVVKYVCPAVLEYSPDFQAALDREVASIDAPYLFQILNDYGVTRDGIRKCIQKRDAKKKTKR
jgi:lipoprotein NlpI